MSWSVSFIGTPEKICQALDAYSNQVSGYSKDEFERALPSLKTLVSENFGQKNDPPRALSLQASGHGTTVDNKPIYGYCQVKIENIGQIV